MGQRYSALTKDHAVQRERARKPKLPRPITDYRASVDQKLNLIPTRMPYSDWRVTVLIVGVRTLL